MREQHIKVILEIILVSVLFVACVPGAKPDSTSGTQEDLFQTAATDSMQPTQTIWQHEAALTRFLDQTNHNGEIEYPGERNPPGTLPEVWQIPKAKQQYVGQDVFIILSNKQQTTPFYYSCKEDGTERLAVFISAERIPLLMIFETNLGGITGLYQHIKNEIVFEGKVLAMTNVSYREGCAYPYNVCYFQENVAESEIFNNGTDLTNGECVGVVGSGVDVSDGIRITGGQYSTASKKLQEKIDWMNRLFERFSLESIF